MHRDRPESRWRRLLWGRDFTGTSYFLSRWLFLRLLGVIFLIAFVSLWCQINGLISREGVLPATDYLDVVRRRLGNNAYWRLPTLCWFGGGDTMLHGLCAAGTVLSLLLIVGVAPILVLLSLWLTYLSLMLVGQAFLSFQWDILLLETAFLSVFLAPATLLPRPSRERAPSSSGIWLLRWLLFKLMFLSGTTKLLSGDPTWWDLTALDVHYETQPLPTWIGWYAHQLPSWFQKTSVALMFVIEIAVPVFVFAPRRLRHVACGALILFQVLIATTGNYGFFNLIAMVLCVPLLDDRLLRRVLPQRWSDRFGTRPRTPNTSLWRHLWLVPAAALFFVSGLTFARELVQTHHGAVARQQSGRLARPIGVTLDYCDRILLSWAQPHVLDWTDRLRTISGYGLFRVMTTQRPEIVIEGSDDGQTWLTYEFRWKTGDVKRRPRYVAPHQPRLDWQMWFAALNPRGNAYWLQQLMQRLLEDSPEVVALLANNPFPQRPPKYVRLMKYQYHFTDCQSRRATGAWWWREKGRALTESISLPAGADKRTR